MTDDGKGTRERPTGQLRRTTERHDRRLRQLLLFECFSTTRQIADQWFEETN